MGCSLPLGGAHRLGGNKGEVDADCEQMIPTSSVRFSSKGSARCSGHRGGIWPTSR